MNTNDIRPQDDLYRFVNHEWLESTDIPPDYSAWSNGHELTRVVDTRLHEIVTSLEEGDFADGTIEQMVRDFYISGMDEEQADKTGRETLKNLLDGVDECKNLSDIYKYVGYLHRSSVTLLWSLFVSPDEKGSDKYALFLHQGGLSLPSKDYYVEEDEDMTDIQSAFKDHIQHMFQELGYDNIKKSIPVDVYDLEFELARASRSEADLRDVHANYNKFSHHQLKKRTPRIDWDAYFDGLDIEPPKELVVGQPEFFEAVSTLLKESQVETVRQYLKWHIVADFAGKLGEDIARENFEFFGKKLSGTEKMTDRWRRVIHNIDDLIGEALGRLYVERHFPPEAKAQVEEMVTNIKQAFADRLKELDWLKDSSKKQAFKKLDATLVKIGYPDEMMRYTGLTIRPDSYLDNYIAGARYMWAYWLNRIGRPVDRSVWLMSPPTVNAYYMPTTNEIAFPAGILQSPFFDAGGDEAENYGGIGAVIGHELTHGFDDQGSLYDADGNIYQWQSDSEQEDFNRRAQVMVKQADDFEVLDGRYLQGKLTLGENIADVGGLKIAYDALRNAKSKRGEQLKPEDAQEFFINYARAWRSKKREEAMKQHLLTDEHAPGEFRTNNSVRNIGAFYWAFEVNSSDKLYLDQNQRLDIW